MSRPSSSANNRPAWVAGTTGGYRLVLVGVGVAAAMTSVIQYLLARSNTWDVQLALRWLVGSVTNVPWSTIGLLAAALAVLLPILAVLARALPAFTELVNGMQAAGALSRSPLRLTHPIIVKTPELTEPTIHADIATQLNLGLSGLMLPKAESAGARADTRIVAALDHGKPDQVAR